MAKPAASPCCARSIQTALGKGRRPPAHTAVLVDKQKNVLLADSAAFDQSSEKKDQPVNVVGPDEQSGSR
ncbi:hypothetical protein PT274_04170 [Leuconostocaceae bacterium ESL0958]|nr:hypothetical protein [Leuconostocaceae bacterium ESL0958]